MSEPEVMELRYKDYYCVNSRPNMAYRHDYKKPGKKITEFCDENGRPNYVVIRNGFNFSYIDENEKLWNIKWKGF